MAHSLSPVEFRVPPVDAVALETRAADLSTRSIKKAAKLQGMKLAIAMMDLTTLEGMDSPGKVRQLCAKAARPLPTRPDVPSCAAVCVYPDLVEVAVEALRGTTVQVASVATGFPAGRTDRATKLREVQLAVAAGATEIDMVAGPLARHHLRQVALLQFLGTVRGQRQAGALGEP